MRTGTFHLVGKPAPAIQGTDIDGRPFDLSAHRGKVVLVAFGATWSLPTAAGVATLQETFDAHHAAGFEIVGVNVEQFVVAGRSFQPDFRIEVASGG